MNERKLVVIGQGYVGLPVAVRAAEVGFRVVGLDSDPVRVQRLNDADSFVEDITSETLKTIIESGRYSASTDYGDAAGFDVAVITVPTPLNEGLPDLTFIEDSARALAPHLRPGVTVVLESTTYPGTTEELVAPILEDGSGLSCISDFHLGYSPERIDPGNPTWGLVNTPKVVSGIGEAATVAVNQFYSQLVERTVPVHSPKEAELTKLLENTFRHVNIALVNELAIYAYELGIDVWESIDAASTKPFGFMRFTPGPGVGGHCLPVDPSYLSWQVKRQLGRNFRFVELANDINDHMPEYVVRRLMTALNKRRACLNGARILMLGFAYKRNTSDLRESPAEPLANMLLAHGVDLRICEPHKGTVRIPVDAPLVPFTAAELAEADAVVVVTDHDDFDWDVVREFAPYVLDTRNVVGHAANVEIL
jgi:nucleotide sugar dehydrogenase